MMTVTAHRDAFEALTEARDDGDRFPVDLAARLAQVRELRYYRDWGFPTFRHFVEKCCGIGYRKARLIADVHQNIVGRLGVPGERLGRLEWSKAALVSPVLTAANLDELLRNVEEMSYRDLRDKVGTLRMRGSRGVSLRMTLTPEQNGRLRQALDQAASVTRQVDDSTNLEWIAMSFVTSPGGSPGSRAPAPVPAPTGGWRVPRPAEEDFFVLPTVWDQLAFAMANGVNVLLIGPSGCGKSELCYRVAEAAGRRVEAFNCGGMSEPRTTLIGNTHFDKGRGTFFTESRFVRAVRSPGGCVLLDEISRAPREAFNILLPLLDGQGYLALDEREDGEVVRRSPGVAFVATANLGVEYTGAEALDKALKDRFAVVVALDFPPIDKELKLLKARCPGLADAPAQRLLKLADRQRALARDGDFIELVSTRALLQAGRQVAAGMKLEDAVQFCVINHFSAEGGDASERAKLAQIFQKG